MTREMDKDSLRSLIHTPAELSAAYVRYAELIQENPGIPFYVECIDDKVIPQRPGNLTIVCARPGHGKTSIMAYIANRHAEAIRDAGRASKECVIYITWEQMAEELEAFFQARGSYSVTDFHWGRVPIDTVRKASLKRASLPLYIIGHSVIRTPTGKGIPRLFPSVVLAAIETMEEDFGVKPTLLCFDYMQIIPIERASDRVQQVTEAPVRIKEVAARVGASALVGAQARQEVDDRKIKIPGLRDAQWASAIGQTADKMFGLWRPALNVKAGSSIKIEDRSFEVTETLLINRLLKQRGDQGRATWGMYFDPAYLKLAEMEIEVEDNGVPF